MRSLSPSRRPGAEAMPRSSGLALGPTREPARAPDAAPPRLHFLSVPSLLWTSALVLWWWAMQGAEIVNGLLALVAAGTSSPRPLLLAALAALGLVTLFLVHFVVVASAEVLRWLWRAAAHWLGLSG
jgi:hypothetical protein